MNLIKFETKKMWSTSKIRFLISLVLLLLLVFFFYCLPKEQHDLVKLVETYGEATNLTSKKIKKFTITDWQTLLNEENTQMTTYVKIMPAFLQQGPLLDDTSPGYTYYKKSSNLYLIDQGIAPISERYGTTGANFSSIVLTLLASSLGLVVILLIFGDSLVNTIETNSIQLTLSQPISRKRYLLSLYFLTWFQGILFSLLLIGSAFLLGSSISGIGHFDYPTIVSTSNDASLIPLWQSMRNIFITWIFVLGFVLALHFLLSVLFKKSSVTLLGTLWLLSIAGIFSSQRLPFLMPVAHLNPFSYLNVGKAFNNVDWQIPKELSLSNTTQSATIIKINDSYYGNLSLSRYLQNPEMTVLNGVICLTVGILILLTVANHLFSKKTSLN